MPLAGKQTGPQGAEPEGGGGGGDRGGVVSGLRLAAGGKKKGMGGARRARGIGVKEMLTDTINVICLLPQEVDGSLYRPFVPPTFSPLALHGLTVWKKSEGGEAKGQHTQVDTTASGERIEHNN